MSRSRYFDFSVNEDSDKTEELIEELKELVRKEEGLKVPEGWSQ